VHLNIADRTEPAGLKVSDDAAAADCNTNVQLNYINCSGRYLAYIEGRVRIHGTLVLKNTKLDRTIRAGSGNSSLSRASNMNRGCRNTLSPF
jgi:hypothetical protein